MRTLVHVPGTSRIEVIHRDANGSTVIHYDGEARLQRIEDEAARAARRVYVSAGQRKVLRKARRRLFD